MSDSTTHPLTVAVCGLGTTGTHVVRHLAGGELSPDDADSRTLQLQLHDRDKQAERQAERIVDSRVPATFAPPVNFASPLGGQGAYVTILATPCRNHVPLAAKLLRAGSHVVSISDSPEDVVELLQMDGLARSEGRSLVVGAGMAPGLSCLLARRAGDQLDSVDAINVAKAGTAGPACAQQHHQSLKRPGRDWVGDHWELRAGGSGRDLAWFPEPIGARDCYRGALPSPTLLHRQYPEARRLSARVSATRRDRLTSRLPMLRKPHEDGGPGAVRVEVRGWRDGAVETIVYAVMAFPSIAAAAVATAVALRAAQGEVPPGASGLSEWPDANGVLADIRHLGIPISAFAGS